ncbi:hypothetical protein HDU80_005163 [Chytriomyces hyalinus]|nr:hypothetical protein HDU80_005163 [Chytriomyces hyalinus]
MKDAASFRSECIEAAVSAIRAQETEGELMFTHLETSALIRDGISSKTDANTFRGDDVNSGSKSSESNLQGHATANWTHSTEVVSVRRSGRNRVGRQKIVPFVHGDAALRSEQSGGEQTATESAEKARSSLAIATSEQSNGNDIQTLSEAEDGNQKLRQLKDSSVKKRHVSDATYYGQIEDALDAKLVIEACIKGVLMKVNDVMEAPSITIRPGTVLVIHERDGSIQRWRDGFNWSPSRLNAGFLTYRQVERLITKDATETKYGTQSQAAPNGTKPTKAKTYSIIPGGLTKKTISIVGSDQQSYRVISYHEIEDPEPRNGLSAHKSLPRPSHDEFFEFLEQFAKGAGGPSSKGKTLNDKTLKKRKRISFQTDRRYPEYIPEESEYAIMYPYRRVPTATNVSRPGSDGVLNNGQIPQQSATLFPAQQYEDMSIRPFVGYNHVNLRPHDVDPSYSCLPIQHHVYQQTTGGFLSQHQYHQQDGWGPIGDFRWLNYALNPSTSGGPFLPHRPLNESGRAQ